MDIYVVIDGDRVVGASARLQGAELIRADEARRLAEAHRWLTVLDRKQVEATIYEHQLRVVNTELRDLED